MGKGMTVHPWAANIAGIEDAMQAGGLPPYPLLYSVQVTIGRKDISVPLTVLDAFIAGGLIASKGAYKRAAIPLWVNAEPVQASDPWPMLSYAVLLCGKRRNLATVVYVPDHPREWQLVQNAALCRASEAA